MPVRSPKPGPSPRYVLRQAAARREALSAGADAGAAVSLQPGLRRLRQDPVPGRNPAAAAHARAVLRRGRRVRRADRLDPRRRAAACTRRSTRSSPASSPGRSTSISAPTPSSSKNRCRSFKPSKYLAFSVHLDGPREEHDHAVCRDGNVRHRRAGDPRRAERAAFASRPTPRCSTAPIPSGSASFFDELMDLGVEGMMISPGYSYEKAPGPGAFSRAASRPIDLFRRVLAGAKRSLAIQPDAAVPRIPAGQLRPRMHALGQPDLQHLRLAAAVLPARRRLLRNRFAS